MPIEWCVTRIGDMLIKWLLASRKLLRKLEKRKELAGK